MQTQQKFDLRNITKKMSYIYLLTAILVFLEWSFFFVFLEP